MTITPNVAQFLRSLPDDDTDRVLAILDTVTSDPDAPSPRVRKLAPNLWECRIRLASRRAVRVLFSYRDGTPLLLRALMKKDGARHQREIVRAQEVRNAA